MPTRTIKLEDGTMRFAPPTKELIAAMREYLPFGMAEMKPPDRGIRFGLVSKCGERELHGVRVPLDPQDLENAYMSMKFYDIFVATSIPRYLNSGFSGLFMPAPYLRNTNSDRVEAGMFYFGAPSTLGKENKEYEPDGWDAEFGPGFSVMFSRFKRAMKESGKELPITFSPELAPVSTHISDVEVMDLGFMIVGPHVVCLKRTLSKHDPAWSTLLRNGIDRIYHCPTLTVTIKEKDLQHAKNPE